MSKPQLEKPADAGTEAYVQALETALEEANRSREAAFRAREDLAYHEKRLVELNTLIDQLWRFVPVSEHGRLTERIRTFNQSLSLPTEPAGEVVSNIVQLVRARPSAEWNASAIRDELENRGCRADPKAVYNALDRLARTGDLVRVRRGVYRSRTYGFGVEAGEGDLPVRDDAQTDCAD